MPGRKGTKAGLKWTDKKEPIHLFQFTEVKVKRYKWERKSNPYLEMKVERMTDDPFPEVRWYGNAEREMPTCSYSVSREIREYARYAWDVRQISMHIIRSRYQKVEKTHSKI